MTVRGRYREEHVREPILNVLASGSIMTTQQVTRLVEQELDLGAEDRANANARPNEMKIDGIIANALQTGRQLCRDGLVERVCEGEFRITEKGRAHLADFQADIDQMSKILDGLMAGKAK